MIKEKVQYLGGVVFTPNAFAIAPVVEEAKIPTVIFNAATSSVLRKIEILRPHLLHLASDHRAHRTLRARPGRQIHRHHGFGLRAWRRCRDRFRQGVRSRRRQSHRKIRVPLKTTDFAPFMQRAKGMSAQAMFMVFPGGPPSFAAIKAYKDNDLRGAGIRLFGTSEADERDLPAIGDAALGLESGMFYSGWHDLAANKAFVDALKAVAPTAVANPSALEGFDGMAAIYRIDRGHQGSARSGRGDGGDQGLCVGKPARAGAD